MLRPCLARVVIHTEYLIAGHRAANVSVPLSVHRIRIRRAKRLREVERASSAEARF